MPREKAPKDPIPTVQIGPPANTKWQDKQGNVVTILTKTHFHYVNLDNGERIAVDDFYKQYKPFEEKDDEN